MIHAELAAGAGPVQGLHRDAEVQHVPVAAHDGDRAGGQAGRAADPHPRHAPDRRVRHRRALEVQGGRQRDRHPGHRGRRGDGLAAPAARLAARDRRTRASSWTSLRFDLGAREVFVFTPEGRRDRAAGRLDPGRLRLRRAHRGRAPLHRRPGQRPAGGAGDRRSSNGDIVEVFTSKAEGAGPSPGLADVRRLAAGRRPRSGSGSPRSAARTRSRPARTRSAGRCARPGCRCSGCSAATRCSRSPGTCASPT